MPFACRMTLSISVGMLLAGCATVTPPAGDAGLQECRQLFLRLDEVVKHAGVRDHGPYPVAGFPYLRSNRFYASFRHEISDHDRFSAWVADLAVLDAEARRLELLNLPPTAAARLGNALNERLDNCRIRLINSDLAIPARRVRLRSQAEVPDDYLSWQRIIGLYPITSLFISSGVSRWHKETRRTFAIPLDHLPLTGSLVRWASPNGEPFTAVEVREMLQHSLDPLGIPRPGKAELDRLFAAFSPIWEVDVADGDDLIGTPAWRAKRLTVDTERPAQFRKVSYTRFHGRVLLQLNYMIWFPARNSDDIYGGRIDGIDWRVTLGPDGKPWMYDAMHNCGCYHLFFPTRKLRLRSGTPGLYTEPPLVPQQAPEGGKMVVRIAHQTHYIQRLYATAKQQPTQPLARLDYNLLRSLPSDGGHRSMFGANGIVPGSERPERFILWPTGVRSPGAMRQWGRHNTAFVGKRHFDDPYLVETLFEEVKP